MSDVQRLQAAFDEGTLVRPDASAPNSVDLSAAIAKLAGVDSGAMTGHAERMASLIGENQHLVFVLVDGLGDNLVAELNEESFLWANNRLHLQTVFPSTTVAALTSLATGCWPAAHGASTWWAYLAEFDISATILPFIERFSKRSLSKWGIECGDVFGTPSLTTTFPRIVRSFMPKPIATSVYTGYASGGTDVVPYTTLAGAVDSVVEWIGSAGEAPTYSYFYYPRVDAFAHEYGPDHELVRAETHHVDHELERLRTALPKSATIVIIADHGLVTIPQSGRHWFGRDDELMAFLRAPPSGEPRVPLFHVGAGQEEEFVCQFRDRFGEWFALLSACEAEDLRMFGPETFAETSRRRIGDFVAIALDEDVLVYEPPEWMTGFHAGLTQAEMLVPLIVA